MVRQVLSDFINGETDAETVKGICVIFDKSVKIVCGNYERFIELSKELLQDLNSIKK